MEPVVELPVSILALMAYAEQKVDPIRIVLYGSRARGDSRVNSDYDLAFELDPDRHLDWLRFLADADDLPITLQKVDLVNLAEVDERLRRSILREGRVQYERN